MNFFFKETMQKNKFYALKILTKSSEKFSLLFLKHLFVPCLPFHLLRQIFFIKKERDGHSNKTIFIFTQGNFMQNFFIIRPIFILENIKKLNFFMFQIDQEREKNEKKKIPLKIHQLYF